MAAAAPQPSSITKKSKRRARSLGSPDAGVGYGPLASVKPSNPEDIAAAGFPDLAAFPILALPHGFHYRAFSIIGGTLSDGNPVPVNHDGMAAFAHPNDRHVVRLIRNQEDRAAPGLGSIGGPAETRYDPLGGGGNVTLDYDERRHRLVQDYVSLNGTIVNCAGGIGFGFGGWLTCEETTAGPPTWGQPHGYVFEVPLNVEPGLLTRPEPIKGMGRFSHEAVAVDQRIPADRLPSTLVHVRRLEPVVQPGRQLGWVGIGGQRRGWQRKRPIADYRTSISPTRSA